MLVTIQAAGRRCGLSPHVIRIWERRYGALTPTRTGSNRRMYSSADIDRLTLLRELTEEGHRISSIARLGDPELAELRRSLQPAPASRATGTASAAEALVAAAIEAARAYDSAGLMQVLQRARSQFGQRGMLHQVICPLIHDVGQAWQDGSLRPGHEHIATAAIREALLAPVPGSQLAVTAPELVIATPAGEQHELGALLVAASARDLGWRVTYLGANLPMEEIAACAGDRRARAVALSVVYPDRCPVIEEKLRRMRQLLPGDTELIVGGRAAHGYAGRLGGLDIHWVRDLKELDHLLMKLSCPA